MIDLVRVKEEDEATLQNLVQFYIYEFTVFQDIKLEVNGSFAPFDLQPYWTEADLHAFFIMHDGELAGFAMVESGVPNVILEFFIMRKFYRKGFGTDAAVKLFDLFPGNWSITQVQKNEPARNFWRKVIGDYNGGNYIEKYDEHKRSIQEFDSLLTVKN
ncbi:MULTISPECIES: GNAT family N-acetyltransferase [unclassified Bacillus (in: firmicutes)]|uniref:GNAT family N-acetyltransferase n=1 Tax=unclassified Bacillus (in: firmicutes) TaxID=185979 RepID=UPI001BE77139|nr:GNAT family N-acetyltransferase [Bacillus sp. ISL-39]MBT2661134.1 GNAT family N-acetyltransferase [Bacillus sp. ISL-45]